MKTIEQIIAEQPDATDAEILAAAEASREYRRVPVAEVKLWLLSHDLLGPLYVIRDTATDPQIRGGLSEFLAGLSLYESIDATDTAIRTKAMTLAGGLTQAQVISGEQYADFISLLKEPNTVTQHGIDVYRRSALIASSIASAAEMAAAVNTYNAQAQAWIDTGVGDMPEWI